MIKKLYFLTIAIVLLLASCTTTHSLTQNNTNEDAIIAKRNGQVQRDFIYNLIFLAKCNPQILNDYAYMYNFYENGFSSLYFNGFNNLQFTPHKLYLSYDPTYRIRSYAINEYVSQYANPHTPAPAGFQKNNMQINNSKYLQPVEVTRGYHYVSGSNIDYAATNGKTATNKDVVRNYDNSTSHNSANTQSSKFANVNQPVKTYSPTYADNNNNYQSNFNNDQLTNSTPNNSQVNNSGNTKTAGGSAVPH